MSTALAIYSALGVTVGAFLLRGFYAGRLRWYNVAFAIPFWPVILIGGLHVARRGILQDRADRARNSGGEGREGQIAALRANLHRLPFKLRMEARLLLAVAWVMRVVGL